MIELFQSDSGLFTPVLRRDRDLIRVRENYFLWIEAMKARIACEQRIHSATIGQIFLTEQGGYPEGELERLVDEVKANDAVLQSLAAEEKRRKAVMERSLEELDAYQRLFKPIEGIGPSIAARIIANVGDIRRFLVDDKTGRLDDLYRVSREIEERLYEPLKDKVKHLFAKTDTIFDRLVEARQYLLEEGRRQDADELQRVIEANKERSRLRRKLLKKAIARFKAYCGLHLIEDDENGSWVFPRRRRGIICNWSNNARQVFSLLTDQFNRRPDSQWGAKLRENKARLRAAHPNKIVVNGKGRYSDIHIHKMPAGRRLASLAR